MIQTYGVGASMIKAGQFRRFQSRRCGLSEHFL